LHFKLGHRFEGNAIARGLGRSGSIRVNKGIHIRKISEKGVISPPLIHILCIGGVLRDCRNILGHQAMPRSTFNKIIRILGTYKDARKGEF
jgi:hypothetical protein